ncbi:unnamed protein product [Sphagnum jensenii]
MANRRDIQFMYSSHNKATVLDCSFIVDSTNGNGFGVRSFKNSARVASVYMHSTVPNSLNPNPESGIIVVNLQDNYARYLSGYSGFVSPLSGSTITSGLTIGAPYVIVSLGSSTVAQWQTAGLATTITPAIGASFIAKATSIAGGGAVQAPATAGSGIDHIEVIGDPNVMNNSSASVLGQGGGMQFILGCYYNDAITAPADGTTIGLNFYLNNSAFGT